MLLARKSAEEWRVEQRGHQFGGSVRMKKVRKDGLRETKPTRGSRVIFIAIGTMTRVQLCKECSYWLSLFTGC